LISNVPVVLTTLQLVPEQCCRKRAITVNQVGWDCIQPAVPLLCTDTNGVIITHVLQIYQESLGIMLPGLRPIRFI
jgi:hypothetical protein